MKSMRLISFSAALCALGTWACSSESEPSSGLGDGDSTGSTSSTGATTEVENGTGGQGQDSSGATTDDSTTTAGGGGSSTDGDGWNLNQSDADCPAPVDLGVRIVGRHDGCTEGAVRMEWSGTGFVAQFEGTGLTFTQSGRSIHYTVVVDGQVQPTLVTTGGEETIEAVSGLESGTHVVEVYRQGEASFGAIRLLSVDAIGGDLLEPPARPQRSIEIFGDSITCGYGNEGEDSSCGFSAETENHYLSYGAILARSFDAELSTVAWSGKGVVVNYGGDMGTTLPEMLERAIPSSDTSVWDFSAVKQPDAVIINLGTNDFSTDNDPSDADFLATYTQMLSTIRARYPEAFVLCTIGPLLSGTDLSKARAGIDGAVQALKDGGDDRVESYELQAGNPDPGCDWHPSLATHETMASELEQALASHLGW